MHKKWIFGKGEGGTLTEDLSSFFIVSRISVKYRLIEVGLLDRIAGFEDFDAVFAEINNSKELVALTPATAYKLLSMDSCLQEWICGGQFVFVDGYFVLRFSTFRDRMPCPQGRVQPSMEGCEGGRKTRRSVILADKKYITVTEDGLHLTARAKKNLAQCVINIYEQKFKAYRNIEKDFLGFALYHKDGIDQRILTFHPKYQANFKYEASEAYSALSDHILAYNENEEIELVKRLGDPTTTLCQCLWYLMENRKWKYPEKFYENTGLHKNYHGRIKKDQYNNMGTDVLMAICVGLRLNLRMIEKIFDKSNNKLNYYQDPDKTYIHILECMPGLSLQDFNGILQQTGIKELGSTIKDDPD